MTMALRIMIMMTTTMATTTMMMIMMMTMTMVMIMRLVMRKILCQIENYDRLLRAMFNDQYLIPRIWNNFYINRINTIVLGLSSEATSEFWPYFLRRFVDPHNLGADDYDKLNFEIPHYRSYGWWILLKMKHCRFTYCQPEQAVKQTVESALIRDAMWRQFTVRLLQNADRLFPSRTYRNISNIRRTKSPNLNVSRLVLQLFLPNPMKPCVKSRMKM